MKMSAAVLVFVGMVSIGLLYSVHQRHLEEQRRDQIAFNAGVEIMSLVPDARETPQALVEEAKDPERQAHRVAQSKPEQTLESMRSHLMELRQDFDRHEKMLRYVMERYMEKQTDTKALVVQGGKVLEAHHAGEVNFSFPELARTSEIEAAAASETKRRSMRGGRDKSVGLSLPEAAPAAFGTATATVDRLGAGDVAAIDGARDDSGTGTLIHS